MHSHRPLLLVLILSLCIVPQLFAGDGPQSPATSAGCRQFVVHEQLQGTDYRVLATMGGQPSNFTEITSFTLPTDTKAAGNVTLGYEGLLFNFPDGSFVLNGQYEVIGDMAVVAEVHGAGDISNGTGAYTGATGHLNYQGPFTVGVTGFTYLDLYYRGQVCLK